MSPDFSGDVIYVDVFHGGAPVRHDGLANSTGEDAAAMGALQPATVSSMMCRVSRNIVNAINGRPASGLELSWFAALTSVTILEPNDYLYGRLCDVIWTHPSLSETDLDIIELISGSHDFDGSDDHLESCRQARHYDQVGRPPKLKSEDYWMVRFSVGQIFNHRLFQYAHYRATNQDIPE